MKKKIFCILCKQNGYQRKAYYNAEQSMDSGKTITQIPICKGHAEGWNECADWKAKLHPIIHCGKKRQ